MKNTGVGIFPETRKRDHERKKRVSRKQQKEEMVIEHR